MFLLLQVLLAWNGAQAKSCPKFGFSSYHFQKNVNGEDRYYNAAAGVTLMVKCHPTGKSPSVIIEKLKKESSVRNTTGDAVYFEFNQRGRYKRVYVVTRMPPLELVFSTRSRHRAALDGTQILVEKQFPKSWDADGPKSP